MNNSTYMDNTKVAPQGSTQNKNSSLLQSMMKSIQEFATLSRVLRIIGAFIVVASMSTFLLQDWAEVSDVNRFYMLLVQTALLALAGLGLSFVLKENKGGRVFFNLSLLSVTANLTTLGALIFSIMQWGGGLTQYPSFASWQVVDIGSLFLALLAAVLLAMSVALFGFAVMARQSFKLLTMIFIVNNSLLLVPVRDSLFVGLLALSGVMIGMLLLRQHSKNNKTAGIALRTFEGRLALMLLFLPIVIMLVRSFWLYSVDAFLYLVLSTMAFVALRMSAMSIVNENSVLKRLLDWLSVFTVAFVAVPSTSLLLDIFSVKLVFTFASTIFAALTLYVANQASRNQGTFTAFAAIQLALLHVVQLFIFNNGISALFCIAAGVAVMVLAKAVSRKYLFVLGVLTSLSGLFCQLVKLFEGIDFTNWLSMSIIGVVTIIAASVLERYGAAIKLKWKKWSTA